MGIPSCWYHCLNPLAKWDVLIFVPSSQRSQRADYFSERVAEKPHSVSSSTAQSNIRYWVFSKDIVPLYPAPYSAPQQMNWMQLLLYSLEMHNLKPTGPWGLDKSTRCIRLELAQATSVENLVYNSSFCAKS